MDLDLGQLLFGGHNIINIMQTGTINDFIAAILPNIYVLAGLILFLYMAFGGFKVIAGAGDAKSTDEGKDMITKAVIGFLIIFASYWIIEIIEIITGLIILG